jgi:hypothetical protein
MSLPSNRIAISFATRLLRRTYSGGIATHGEGPGNWQDGTCVPPSKSLIFLGAAGSRGAGALSAQSAMASEEEMEIEKRF